MGKDEKTSLQETINGLVFYRRYVDDIFCLTDGTTDTEELVQKFNSAHPSRKFTAETEADKEDAFLDVLLHRQEDGSIQRRVFRKKTWTGQYVNFHSFVPLIIKRNLVQGLAARVRRICSPEAIEEELQQLRNTLRENGYPDRFILRNIGERVEKPTVATAEKKDTDSELADLAFADSPIVNACAFLSRPYKSRAVVSSSPWIPSSTPLCAAAVGGYICIWSLPELSKIFDVCAHRFMVTSLRLFPHGHDRSSGALSLLTLNNGLSARSSPVASTVITFCLTAGSTDGVVKSYELQWTGFKGDNSSFTTAPPIPESGSPSLHSAAIPLHVNVWRRSQPHPFWAELFDVVFGQRGDFLAIGSIKASCNLQLLYRNTYLGGTVLSSPPDSQLCCVEIDVSSSHPFAQRRRTLVPITTATGVGNGTAVAAAGDSIHHHPAQKTSTAAERAKLIEPSTAAFSKDLHILAVGYETAFLTNPDRSAFWHRRSFSADAPSAGGSWLLRLCWPADGSVLYGLSDRLCVWPFARSETGQSRPHVAGVAVTAGSRSGMIQSSVKSASGDPSQLELFRCL
nr:unnamed protein product [Spirometra erinaceieuropaei]